MKTVLDVGPLLAPGKVKLTRADGSAQGQATVDEDGKVVLDGLDAFAGYVLSGADHDGSVRQVAFNAAGPRGASLAEQAAGAASAPPPVSPPAEDDPDVPEHNFERSKGEAEPQPSPKYVDVKGPQRTGADLGTAYPKDPDEHVPHPPLSAVKGPQRTGAEEGYAYPKDPKESLPGVRYEDEKGPQRTGADLGTAYPKPKTDSRREQAKVRDSSKSKARGATKAQAGTSKAKPKSQSKSKSKSK